MTLPIRLAIAVCVALAVYFAIQVLMSVLNRRQATTVALAEALIEEQARDTKKAPLGDRLAHSVAARGWTGMLAPLILATALLWGILALAGFFFTGNRLLSLLVTAPLAVAILWIVGGVVGQKRKATFDRQLISVLALVAGQLEAGNPVQRSLQQATLSVDDPLRGELVRALDEAAASRDLIRALRGLSERYPSKAFDLFLAALEIDRDAGGRIEPALRQAADSLQKDYELAQEANAEVAQAKIEYAGILVIMAFIAFSMFGGADSATRAAYYNPISIMLLIAAAANFAWGVLRAQNMFRRASGQRTRKLDRIAKKEREAAENGALPS